VHGASNTEGFVISSRAFNDYYNGQRAEFNNCEWRAKKIFDEDKAGHPPWTWDWENYSGENEFMVGFYYEEDLNNINQQKALEAEWAKNQKEQSQS